MAKLLQNERMKLYKKPSTWVLSGVVILLMLSTVVLLKVINIVSADNNGYYSQADAWKDIYQSNLQSSLWQLENEPDNIQAQMESGKYKYLLDHEIPPSDWRTDAVAAYFEALGNLKNETAAAESGETPYPEDMIKERIAAYTAQVTGYKKVMESGDWKDFLRLRIEFIKSGYMNDSAMDVPQTPQEREVFVRVLQMQIDMGIEPVSTTYSWLTQTAPNRWKVDKLSTLQKNELALLRGEAVNRLGGEQQPLTSSAKARLKKENQIILKELQTNTMPIDEDGFLGMLDSTTGNLSLIGVLLVVLAGGILAGEFGSGTVKLLLITPHKRQKIFWAKAVLLLEITGLILAGMFVLSFLISAAFNGLGGIGDMVVVSLFGRILRLPFLLIIVLKYLLYMLPVLAYGGLALMLSAVTRKSAVAIAVSLLLMFGSKAGMLMVVLGSVTMLGVPLPGLKFLLFANEDLSVYLPGVSSLMEKMFGMNTSLATFEPTMSLGFTVAVLLLYLTCFLWIGRDSFCRRDIQ